jgi:flap endonuclease-1
LKRLDVVKQFVDGLPAMSQDQSSDISEALAALKVTDVDDNTLKTASATLRAQASLDALKEVSQGEKDREVPLSRPNVDKETRVSASLKSAFDNFRTSMTNLAESVEPGTTPPPPDAIAHADSEPDVVLTKAQNQLSVMEEEFWSKLSALTPGELDGSSNYQELVTLSDTLYEQSAKMSSSFDRRTNLPTSDTYSQSKEILRAMGVLVIDAPGETEGEALASSIVLSGKADYVISEDTVCRDSNLRVVEVLNFFIVGCAGLRRPSPPWSQRIGPVGICLCGDHSAQSWARLSLLLRLYSPPGN